MTNDILGFFSSAEKFPLHPALEVEGQVYSYQSMRDHVFNYAAAIGPAAVAQPLVGILSGRTLTTYAAILATLSVVKAYVPLNPKYPVNRLQSILSQSGVQQVVVCDAALPQLTELLTMGNEGVEWIVSPSLGAELSLQFPNHRFTPVPVESAPSYWLHPSMAESVCEENLAYVIFTSGSTGIPKGVGVTRKNLSAYIHNQIERYAIDENDRFSQTADISFDLSIHDLALVWQAGSCLCVVPEKYLFAPGKFIIEQRITCWCSVPSVGIFMDRLRMLQPHMYQALRYVVFCGEALTRDIADKWQKAAPHARIDNLYGPTEATCAMTSYVWQPDISPQECHNGIVPIGRPLKDQKVMVAPDCGNRFVEVGEGELCIAGTQVSRGYINDREKTAKHFITITGSDEVWYRTGDLVRINNDGLLIYLSRIDNLVKIRGYRVELQEIESALYTATGGIQNVVFAWPVTQGIADKIIAFVADATRSLDRDTVIQKLQSSLPEYMIPAQIHCVPAIPMNQNGKVDRKRIVELFQNGEVDG
ncbi:MAG: amino acid adenylation domain-containing protein [Chitinivibrionales bacterium]|nr:amino acid adenylation domain-containing protein [Chitinivibrionales bacterium]